MLEGISKGKRWFCEGTNKAYKSLEEEGERERRGDGREDKNLYQEFKNRGGHHHKFQRYLKGNKMILGKHANKFQNLDEMNKTQGEKPRLTQKKEKRESVIDKGPICLIFKELLEIKT